MIVTPEQAYAVLLNLPEPERPLTLLAAGTGLRISECLGLQWQDVSFAEAGSSRCAARGHAGIVGGTKAETLERRSCPAPFTG